MRLIHTSDWHLGRTFHRVGLLAAQAAYLDHLVETVRAERVDAVLVSGDVYDRALPSPDTVALLDDALTRLVDAGAQVVLSSGNHDSATRLGFGSALLRVAGVHLRTRAAAVGTPVLLGDLAVYALPYLEPQLCAEPLRAASTTHADVLRAAMYRVRADQQQRGSRSVVMAHAFVTGGTTSGSERDISIGGVGAVPPEVFEGVDYVALGHLHGPQRVGEHIRYCGSPLAMSFGEAAHTKRSLLVDIGADGVRVQSLPAPVPRPLARLRGTLEELLVDRRYAGAEQAWCEVRLTDRERPLEAMARVQRRFPHTLSLQFDAPDMQSRASAYPSPVAARDELALCCDFLEHVRGAAAGPAERDVLRSAIEGSRTARAAHEDEGQDCAAAPDRAPGRRRTHSAGAA